MEKKKKKETTENLAFIDARRKRGKDSPTQKTIGQGQIVLFSEEYDITKGTRNRPLSVYAVAVG